MVHRGQAAFEAQGRSNPCFRATRDGDDGHRRPGRRCRRASGSRWPRKPNILPTAAFQPALRRVHEPGQEGFATVTNITQGNPPVEAGRLSCAPAATATATITTRHRGTSRPSAEALAAFLKAAETLGAMLPYLPGLATSSATITRSSIACFSTCTRAAWPSKIRKVRRSTSVSPPRTD